MTKEDTFLGVNTIVNWMAVPKPGERCLIQKRCSGGELGSHCGCGKHLENAQKDCCTFHKGSSKCTSLSLSLHCCRRNPRFQSSESVPHSGSDRTELDRLELAKVLDLHSLSWPEHGCLISIHFGYATGRNSHR